jgi:GDP-L-fucose synthase
MKEKGFGMNILVTGGHGMLGSAIDFGLKPSRKELDLFDYDALHDYIVINGVNEIIHCAGAVGGVKANDDFMYDYFMNNIRMNINIIRACKEHNIRKSTFFLSTCIFPHHAPLPLKEETVHDGEPHPTNFGYAYAKRMLEVGSRCMFKQFGIQPMCIIPCNMYGENDDYHLTDGHVIPSLIHRCYLAKQNGTDFVVWGSGKAEREFLYAGDVAAIVKKIHTEDMNGLPSMMTVSPSSPTTIAEIVELIVKHIGFTGRVVFDSSKIEGIMRKNTDNTLFRAYFSDFKLTDLHTGLAKTVEHFVENYDSIRK